jgi:hypothetical protein
MMFLLSASHETSLSQLAVSRSCALGRSLGSRRNMLPIKSPKSPFSLSAILAFLFSFSKDLDEKMGPPTN